MNVDKAVALHNALAVGFSENHVLLKEIAREEEDSEEHINFCCWRIIKGECNGCENGVCTLETRIRPEGAMGERCTECDRQVDITVPIWPENESIIDGPHHEACHKCCVEYFKSHRGIMTKDGWQLALGWRT
jgi:hypothetical protein